MPVLKKREIAAYILLYKSDISEYGEAIDFLVRELCTSRKTARNIIKRLKRIGALKLETGETSIKMSVVDPLEFLELISSGYIDTRREKCLGMKRAVLSKPIPGNEETFKI